MSFDNFPLQEGSAEDTFGMNNAEASTEGFLGNTVSQLRTLWQQRLCLFRDAEKSLQKAKRLMAAWMVVVVAGFSMLSFSLFVAPVTSEWMFAGGFIAFAIGMIFQPFCYVWVKQQRKHRDALSRRFYVSNHEVEITDSHLVLINRGNYAAVTQVPILEH